MQENLMLFYKRASGGCLYVAVFALFDIHHV